MKLRIELREKSYDIHIEKGILHKIKEYINLAKIGLAMVWTSWVSVTIFLIGGFDNLFRALLIMMALDYITGVAKGYKEKNMNSKRAYKDFGRNLLSL